MADRIRPAILCGGIGTRLWPASTEEWPKQFLKLFGPYSTFQETVRLVADRTMFDPPLVLAQRGHRHRVREQLAEINADAEIVLEPERRDSGPAIAAACGIIADKQANALVLVLAADQLIGNLTRFIEAVRLAERVATTGRIVTFGIKPDHPATDYGYIRPGAVIEGADPVRAVERFIEKPGLAAAEQHVAAGDLWNSGNFLFPAEIFLAEFAALEPASADAIALAVENSRTEDGCLVLDDEAFARTERKSIDHAVMEHTSRAAVVPVDCGWIDLGNWNAVWAASQRDADGNSIQGNATVIDSRNSYISSDAAMTTVLGAENLVVIVKDRAVLVAHRDRVNELRNLIDRLRDA